MAPPLRCYTSSLFIFYISLQWFAYIGQAAEPTVIEGSTYILPSGSFTGGLTDVNLSGLFEGTPTSNAVAPSSSNPSSSADPTTSNPPPIVNQSPTPAATSSSEKAATGQKEDNENSVILGTGPIVGIAVGGVVVILVAILLCVFLTRRKKNNKKFDRGRGITPSMVISMRTKTPSVLDPSAHQNTMAAGASDLGYHQKPVQMYYPERSNVMMTQPSESITAAIDQMYNVKQYNTKPTTNSAAFSSITTIPTTMATTSSTPRDSSSNNPRLSKYSYLTQAFTQMRESYNAHSSLSPQPSGASPPTSVPFNSSNSNNTTASVSDTTYLRNPDYMDEAGDEYDNNSNNNDHHNITTATTYLSTNLTPPPPRIAVFNEHSEQVTDDESEQPQPQPLNYSNYKNHIQTGTTTGTMNINNNVITSSTTSRDSITSDVSQYSTFSNPFRYPSPDHQSSNTSRSHMMMNAAITTPQPPPAQQYNRPRKQYNYI
ncbi:hypothetical protein BDA99DRAFT_504418 [Phascolomyces articulosus]|uniref:Mid2 domain-containing protein n=1 Tax=Phascolomyces articulosus TaxID=60185 RepID=A0AAD5KI57_9FUNG|nr:hypothetical protein BDA99DRAFT_504418 [Phascolomyces articulosus]